MSENKVGLSSPWVTFGRKMEALFGPDPEIKVEFDNEAPAVKLYVDNEEKADALSKLLPTEKTFGNVILNIIIIPANKNSVVDPKVAVFKTAFKGNPVLKDVVSVDAMAFRSVTYAIFKNEVVQFFNDDLSDINGNCSTLYQTIARDIFGLAVADINFCTAPKEEDKEKELTEEDEDFEEDDPKEEAEE